MIQKCHSLVQESKVCVCTEGTLFSSNREAEESSEPGVVSGWCTWLQKGSHSPSLLQHTLTQPCHSVMVSVICQLDTTQISIGRKVSVRGWSTVGWPMGIPVEDCLN